MKRTLYAVLLGLSLSTQAALATEYKTFDPARSSVKFVFKQMNVPVEGGFKRFKGDLSFDPAKIAAARATVDIDLASIDAGSAEANDEVAGKLWFDTKTYPQASFTTTLIKPSANNRYDVTGKLSIKGRTHEVSAPATVRIDGNTATFDGSFVLKRADFAIGEGIWADFGTVANEIQIKFHLVANAAVTNVTKAAKP